MKIKATSVGTPPLSGAEAFARLLVAAMENKPALRIVKDAPPAKALTRLGSTVMLGNVVNGGTDDQKRSTRTKDI